MTSALIGYTGFVGSNILRSHAFDDLYNSANIDRISGCSYDLVVTAANRADSYRINTEPDTDRAEIEGFVRRVSTAQTCKLVLVSTVCVYAAGHPASEDDPIHPDRLTPYGRHRFELEEVLRDRFDTLVVRVPQAFGTGQRKGVLYDLRNHYRLDHIRPAGCFQHYDLRHLWEHISTGLDAGLATLNLATPPLSNGEVAETIFGLSLPEPSTPDDSPFAGMYTRDMRTRHAALFGGDDGYLMTRAEVLSDLMRFAASNPSTQPIVTG